MGHEFSLVAMLLFLLLWPLFTKWKKQSNNENGLKVGQIQDVLLNFLSILMQIIETN